MHFAYRTYDRYYLLFRGAKIFFGYNFPGGGFHREAA